MSHFAVLVVGNRSTVEEQLAPYQENNNGDCPADYMEFNDTEDEMRKEYDTGTTTQMRLPDGRLVFQWDREFKVEKADFLAPDEYKFPEGSQEATVPFKEKYKTFEEFAQHYHGHRAPDPETGRYGYWENPDAKWDWFQVGGRWAGFLKIKPECAHLYADNKPNFSWGWDESEKQKMLTSCCVDSAKKGHVDWDAMRAEAASTAGTKYDSIMAVIGRLPANKAWAKVRRDDDLDGSKAEYWAQPRCAEWQKSLKMGHDIGFYESPDDFLCTREQYVERASRDAITLFAILKDGKWSQKGDMGWWGMVANENDAWPDVFCQLLAKVDDDETITVVDCHI